MQAGVAHPRQCAVVVQAGVGMQLHSIEQHTQPLLQHSHCCRCFYAAGRWGMNDASCSTAGRAAWPQQQAQPVPQQGRAAPSSRTCTEPQQQRRRQAKLGRSKGEEGGPGAQALQVSGTSTGPTAHSAVSAGPPYDLVKRQGDEHQAEVVEGYAGGQKQSWRAQHSPEPQQQAAHAPQAGQRAEPASPIATRPFHCCSRVGLCLLT